jgi:hypothetical protein
MRKKRDAFSRMKGYAEWPLNLRGANLKGATLNRCRLEWVDLSEYNLNIERPTSKFSVGRSVGAQLQVWQYRTAQGRRRIYCA